MRQDFFNLEIETNGQKLYNFTDKTENWISSKKFLNGIINLSIQHTSASLIIQENADKDVLQDIKTFFDRLVPMNDSDYLHRDEGIDDMPAHIKSLLTNTHLSIPFQGKHLLLGTWQGIFLFEHRTNPTSRTIEIHIIGE